ncbi:MAG: hypothetical protein HC840_20910 [Leptolyngbyaceae cyanobacterium RM2_2_4]|nr:hypothetical protein [Leptolyngbyaceae cyanobacterium SM1_4_3]NJN90846.1 hypothetical protein [Leptolyngbyaceae cyanobacterium SL_5_14]NJO51485.1 hypothetical protein [Leptolyngbyaceae cyanobacterium RM2_2_4]
MTPIQSSSALSIRYPRRAVERAERAVRCASFQLPLFVVMRQQSVGIKAIAGQPGIQNRYTRRPLPELVAENDLLWLIQTGLLRREVDGQGLTDSFRLTPLGRQLVEQWQRQGNNLPAPNFLDRLQNAWNRWVRLPDWIR